MSIARTPWSLAFMKWHGAGNDFVIIDLRRQPDGMSPALIRALGDRRLGVGFDQLCTIEADPDAAARLDFYNANGANAGACGNATRCAARFLMDEGGVDRLTLRTGRGLLVAEDAGDGLTRVNMGPPQLEWADIPLAQAADIDHLPLAGDPAAVAMGNPHCVFFVQDAEAVDVAGLGARTEHDPLFSQGANVEFVSPLGPDHLRMRVWERGAGITLACGTGVCATAVAAARRGLTGRRVTVDVDGGRLVADWREDGVWLTGPTVHVFDGVLTPAFQEAVE